MSKTWCCLPVIPAFKRLRQNGSYKFEGQLDLRLHNKYQARQGYTARNPNSIHTRSKNNLGEEQRVDCKLVVGFKMLRKRLALQFTSLTCFSLSSSLCSFETVSLCGPLSLNSQLPLANMWRSPPQLSQVEGGNVNINAPAST